MTKGISGATKLKKRFPQSVKISSLVTGAIWPVELGRGLRATRCSKPDTRVRAANRTRGGMSDIPEAVNWLREPPDDPSRCRDVCE